MAAAARRRPVRGAVRLSILLIALVLVAVPVAAAVVYVKATTDPGLGPAPRGPLHGSSELLLAGYAAEQVGRGLVAGRTHIPIALSEQDLGVELAAHPPRSGTFADPMARVRNGLLVVDGHTDVGPFTVHAVGHLAVSLIRDPDGSPDIGVDIREIDAGSLPLPGPIRDRVADRVRERVTLHGLLGSSALAPLRSQLDCVAVGSDGLVLGFHAPGADADPSTCTSSGG